MRFALLCTSAALLTACVPHSRYESGSGRVRPASPPLYLFVVDSSALIPGGAAGYTITANNQARYRIAWSDTNGTSRVFHGSIFTDGTFDANIQSTAGTFTNLVGGSRIDFYSTPGSDVDYIDFFPSAEPITLDAEVGDGFAEFFFVDATTGLDSTTGGGGPAAFQFQ